MPLSVKTSKGNRFDGNAENKQSNDLEETNSRKNQFEPKEKRG
jgi:hypothetical protein